MTILITGATGLIGSRLSPRLADLGFDCRALVRPGKDGPDGVTRVEGDLFDPASLEQAVRGVSAVVHLAAVFRSQDTDLIWKSNLDGARNLIAAVKAHAPQARFILASTTHVYDKASPHPGRETDVVEPEQAYPASKVAAENALRASGLNWAVLRFPFVYGEGDGHLQVLKKHLDAFGFHPAHRMSIIHHRDIATAIEQALKGSFDQRIVNIADEAPTTFYELLQVVGETMAPCAQPMSDPWYLHVDATLSRRLGFRPQIRTVHQAAQEGLL